MRFLNILTLISIALSNSVPELDNRSGVDSMPHIGWVLSGTVKFNWSS
jgi:hypothetical protein